MELEGWRRLDTAERTLVALVIAGLTDEEIAQRSGETKKEVSQRLAALFEKVRVGSRAQLVIQSALADTRTEEEASSVGPAASGTRR